MLNPDVRKKVQNAIMEADRALIEIDGLKEHIKDIIAKLCDEHEELDKKVIRKMIKVYHKQNLSAVKLEHDMLESFYDEVFNSSQSKPE